MGRRQSALLLKNVQTLLNEQGIGFHDITHLATLTGPGSFTGIRVGLSFLKGIAIATRIPLAGAQHFEILKQICPASETGVIILESGRDEKFIARVKNQEIVSTKNITTDVYFSTGMIDSFLISDMNLTDAPQVVKVIPYIDKPVELLVKYVKKDKNRFTSGGVAPYYVREADTTSPKNAF